MLLLLTFLSVNSTFSQRDSVVYNNQIKISPLKIVDLMNPALELSYERRYNRFSSQLSLGYMTDLSGITGYKNLSGFRIAFEEKYFLQNRSKGGDHRRFKPYVGAQLFLNKLKFNDEGKFVDTNLLGDSIPVWSSDSLSYSDNFGIRKTVVSFTLRFGFQIPVRHFVFDLGVGVGLRYRDVTHYDRLVPSDIMVHPRHPNVDYSSTVEGKKWFPTVTVNLKIGYIFGK